MSQEKFRLVTRSDFDGLVCAVLLNELDLIDDIKFVHPKDMQDGKVDITSRDITTNLPYVAAAHLAFDHHLSETIRNSGERKNHIIEAEAPSAARVVYNYYGGKKGFPAVTDEMMDAVDKSDSAQFSRDEIIERAVFVVDAVIVHYRIRTAERSLAMVDADGMDRHDPQDRDAEFFQLRKFCFDAGECALR